MPPDSTSSVEAAAAAGLLRPAAALERAHADGPPRSPAEPTAPAGTPVPYRDPAAPRRRASVTTMLLSALVLLAAWAIGVSGLVTYRGLSGPLEVEQRARAGGAANAVTTALQLDLAHLDAAVQSLRDDAALARVLAAGAPAAAQVLPLAHRIRDRTAADAVVVHDLHGTRWESAASAAASRPAPAPAGADLPATGGRGALGFALLPHGDALLLRAQGPVLHQGVAVGSVAVERLIGRDVLRDAVGAGATEVGLGDGQRVLVRTAPVVPSILPAAPAQRVGASGKAEFLGLGDGHALLLQPLLLADRRLLLSIVVPEVSPGPVLAQWRAQWAGAAALTLLAAALLGALLRRRLVQPIRRLTEHAEALALRHAGHGVRRRGNEFDALAASFEAATDALLGHSERLRQAHLNELRNGVELQRQYALMRLLRGLATAGNESDGLEPALRAALREIGEYLDWPVGRVALLPDPAPPERAGAGAAPHSIWFVRDRARFTQFIAQPHGGPPIEPEPGGPVCAPIGGMPYWIGDLSCLQQWSRREAALAAGLHSALVIPVTARGQVAAFVEFFADRWIEAQAELLELIEAVGIELSRLAERHLAQQHLRRREAEAGRLARVAAQTETAVVVLDTAGRVQWVNAAFTRATGHALAQARGRLPHTLIGPPATDPALVARVADAVLHGRPLKFELAIHHRNGGRGEHQVEGCPLLDERGRYVQYALLATPIAALESDAAPWHAEAALGGVPLAAAPQDGRRCRVRADRDGAAQLDGAVIDRIRAMQRRSAPDLLSRLVGTYLDTAARLVTAADEAIGRHDVHALRQAVHALKAASANLGASELAWRCGEIERLSRGGRLAAACQQWPAARHEYQRAVRALRALPEAGSDADAGADAE